MSVCTGHKPSTPAMNSICTEDEAAEDKTSFIKEIQMMMFGMGDSTTPLESTATMVEEIVLQQVVMIIGQAEEIAEKRGVNDGIYPQDILFLMRKDIHKLNRIVSYIGFKDLKKAVTSSLNEGDMPGLQDLSAATEPNRMESKRKLTCVHFLQSLGIFLPEGGSDSIRNERLHRADQRIQIMNEKTYEEYNQSRRTTFLNAQLGSGKFLEWIIEACPGCPTHKLKSFTVEMLLYLAKETVAQLIDIALLLRKDAEVIPSDPFSRAKQLNQPFETYGPSQKLVVGSPPITVNEVREVMRRFYSTQLCPWGAFNTNVDPTMFNKIIAC